MKQNSIIDYSACILFKAAGCFFRALPLGCVYFLGRRLGDLLYYLDVKHKAVAYANIKQALGDKTPPSGISMICRRFYQGFGENIIEVFLLPKINKSYLKKYVTLEGREHVAESLKKGNGSIYAVFHEGSWELSNIQAANLGFPYVVIVRNLGFPRLNTLLNKYRAKDGNRIIDREDNLGELIRALKNNETVAMTADQGGRSGIPARFFNKSASMSTGALRLALKYGTAIHPTFFQRINGPYAKITICPALPVRKSGDPDKDLADKLQELTCVFEKHIAQYPEGYLWTYKVWKYSGSRNILILSDGKAGHLRQSEAISGIMRAQLAEKGLKVNIETVGVKFKPGLAKLCLTASSALSGKYTCQGCLWCLKKFLDGDTYSELIAKKPDFIISCGSSLAAVNYVLSRESLAKSIVIMRPGILSLRRFDLVVMPMHDLPPRRKNVAVTEGALNLIDEGYLKEQSEKFASRKISEISLGLLVGGDSKKFSLAKDTVSEAIRQLKTAAESLNADLLVTTSRRTPREIETLIKDELENYARCKLLVIANEKNIPGAVTGILGLSSYIATSAESISMISEAASSGKYVLVFGERGLGRKHRRFIEQLRSKKYIYLSRVAQLGEDIIRLHREKPEIRTLRDGVLLKGALSRLV